MDGVSVSSSQSVSVSVSSSQCARWCSARPSAISLAHEASMAVRALVAARRERWLREIGAGMAAETRHTNLYVYIIVGNGRSLISLFAA